MRKYNIVYQTTNLINGMIYVGRHSTDKLEDGYLGSGKRIQQAICEFGKKNFKREILFIFDDPDEMIKKEAELITDEFIKREDTYNCALGGGKWCMLGKKLKPRSAEYRENMSKAKKGKKLPPLTSEHKAAISKKLKGRVGPNLGKKASIESRQKMSESQKGRKHSPETIEKLIELNSGENNPNFGKKASDETKEKMSVAHKGKKLGPQKPEHTEKLRQINLNREYAPQTEEHKEKIRQAHLGKVVSEETKEKIRQTNLRKSFEKKMNILNSIISSIIQSKND